MLPETTKELKEVDQSPYISTEEVLKDGIVKAGGDALNIVNDYLGGGKGSPKVEMAFKMLVLSSKIMHMNQLKKQVERGQNLRAMQYLSDPKVRDAYLKLTHPTIAGLIDDKRSR